MSVNAIKNASTVALKVVTNKIKGQLLENNRQAVANGEQFFSEVSLKPLSYKKAEDTFTITFSYQKNLHRTKVHLTDTGYGKKIYKVALNSSLNSNSTVCWLQNTPAGWDMLLGNDITSDLKNAITSAIEDQA